MDATPPPTSCFAVDRSGQGERSVQHAERRNKLDAPRLAIDGFGLHQEGDATPLCATPGRWRRKITPSG
ncbi:hypothetical protein SESBI_03741 [Sesbania bispinosa]|nr:hypothetical protein SESBI_03741 [Sesbania bispinosa]